MSDDPTDASDPAAVTEAAGSDADSGDGDRDVTTYLEWLALAFVSLAAVVAGVGFYSNVSRIIRIWVSEPYQPVFAAGFNLAVLLVAAGGIVWLARRLS